jgi:hypothetical protein
LATWYRDSLPSAPQAQKEHIAEELFSLTIQGTRYSTKVDEHIRYHVNGYYIRQYMQSKNRWTDKAIDKSKHAGFVPLQKSTKTKGSTLDYKINSQSAPSG